MLSDFNQKRDDSRIIIHFDYDAFYASVVEAENPALKSVPLAIQQKQIVVTCNYEARRRGLHKLQLITDAKRVCPEVVIVLGEDLTRFRDASKFLSHFLGEQIWSGRLERLGFDEVWLDCTDMIDYNFSLLNSHDLARSFFCLDREDPTRGFEFDASTVYGPTYPAESQYVSKLSEKCRILHTRLLLGSHLARYLRHELESQQGYTATVGIATNKILSKLVGNVNKPHSQTTLMPPLLPDANGQEGTIHMFLDPHDIGKVPGIGFKLAQKIRAYILGRQAAHEDGLVYRGTRENVTVRDVRLYSSMGPEKLEEILGGPGAPKGIGGRIWGYLNGYDDSEVIIAKRVPSQISQEDSYMKHLHTFDQVRLQLFLLAERLISRMHTDLMEPELDHAGTSPAQRWLAHPRTLRLTTRPRPPVNADGTRLRTFNRISHSGPMPTFIFSMTETPSVLADKLVNTTLVPMFRKLHPERNGWNLSLINVAATNMAETAADHKNSQGRDIGRMFRRQDDVLKDFKIIDDVPEAIPSAKADTPDHILHVPQSSSASEHETVDDDDASSDEWESADDIALHQCDICGMSMPLFASDAHYRYHITSPS